MKKKIRRIFTVGVVLITLVMNVPAVKSAVQYCNITSRQTATITTRGINLKVEGVTSATKVRVWDVKGIIITDTETTNGTFAFKLFSTWQTEYGIEAFDSVGQSWFLTHSCRFSYQGPAYLPMLARPHFSTVSFTKEVQVPSFVGVGSEVTFTMKMVKDFDGLNTGYFITDTVPSGMQFVRFISPTHKMTQVAGSLGRLSWSPFPRSPFLDAGHVELVVGFVARVVNPVCGDNVAFLILQGQRVIPSQTVSVSCFVPTVAPPPTGPTPTDPPLDETPRPTPTDPPLVQTAAPTPTDPPIMAAQATPVP